MNATSRVSCKKLIDISTNNYTFRDDIFLQFYPKGNKIFRDEISGGIYVEEKLLKRIEGLRKKLNKFGNTRNLNASEVVELSRQLDCLLNQYYRIKANQQLSIW